MPPLNELKEVTCEDLSDIEREFKAAVLAQGERYIRTRWGWQIRPRSRACPQLGDLFTRTDQNQTRNAVL
jgi:hypothetical protein